MGWISYILGGSLVCLAGVLIWWEYRLKYHFDDGRTIDHKRWRKRVLWLTIGLLVLNQINSYNRDQQSETERRKLTEQIGSLTENQTNLVGRFEKDRHDLNTQIGLLSTQLVTINSNQADLSKENLRLVAVLSTNLAVDPATRAAIIEANRRFEVIDSEVVDLNAWVSELDSRRALSEIERERSREEALEAERPTIEQCAPVFDYAVKRLQTILAKLAKQGEISTSTYTQIPTTLTSENVTIAEVSAGTNAFWSFEVSITKFGAASDVRPPRLLIMCNQDHLSLQIWPRLRLNPKAITTTLQIPGEQSITGQDSFEDYKKVIDEGLRNLIAAQSEQLSSLTKTTVPH